MGFSAIARVTEDRWIACGTLDHISFGLAPGQELDVKTTICDEIRVHTKRVVIDDVSTDPVYCGHPTAAMYGFKSYISMPIFFRDGTFFGTLCAIDPEPAKVSRPEIVGMFELFADLIGFYLDIELRYQKSERARLEGLELHRVRDQFIAVLGHDLRNPLASVDAGARMLRKPGMDENKRENTLDLMQKSIRRMSELIDNVLDFARGRLGAGIVINRTVDTVLGPELEQVIAELRSSSPSRAIVSEIDITKPVRCDASRICQLLSNLVANALYHGDRDGQVTVRAHTQDGAFELSVANQGEPIPERVLAHLFEPFTRPNEGSGQGLGLGLYICCEIAKAHGGRVQVKSDSQATRFTFSMPNT